jgi:hypothetical protein
MTTRSKRSNGQAVRSQMLEAMLELRYAELDAIERLLLASWPSRTLRDVQSGSRWDPPCNLASSREAGGRGRLRLRELYAFAVKPRRDRGLRWVASVSRPTKKV